MGYIKHHTIVVTGWQPNEVIEAHNKAKEIMHEFHGENHLVSDIMEGIANTQNSFFIAPDGSKEGWQDSKNGDEARKKFLDWFIPNSNFCDYIEIRFGGDDEHNDVIRSKYSDLE